MTKKNPSLYHIGLLFVISFLGLGALFTMAGNTATAASPIGLLRDQASRNNSPLAPQANWAPPSPAYKIYIGPDAGTPNRILNYVGFDGLYELDYNTLLTAGLPVDTLDPRSFRMFYMGQEIAIQVEGEGDGSFNANDGDAVIFYGQSVDSLFDEGTLPDNKYTETNVYWLSYGGDNGLRMAEPDGTPGGGDVLSYTHQERQETNFVYDSVRPFEFDADHWFGDDLQLKPVAASASETYTFSTDNVAVGAGDGTLTVSMLGYFDFPHHIKLYINDNEVFDNVTASMPWSGHDPFEVTVPVAGSYFQDPTSTVKIEMLKDLSQPMDAALVNWFRVSYEDTLVAENNELLFNNQDTGTWRYQIDNFSADAIQVYDISDLHNVRHFDSTVISGVDPYSVSFGDTVATSSRYIALTPTARKTVSGIEKVIYQVSLYTPLDLLYLGNEADYIIITHVDFWSEAVELAEYRDNDHRVAVIDVQQIYDQFNGGLMSAESIRDFLAYAYSNWTAPAPMFVVLYGDGSADMRLYKNFNPTYIPPFLRLTDIDLGETAAQNRFVTLTGDDILPDMHIGRLPANTVEEAQSMLQKIVAYETECQCNGWNYNTLFVADDLEGGGGDFREYSNRVADGNFPAPNDTVKVVPAAYNITKIYLGDTCDPTNPNPSVECRADIIDTLNNEGALFVSYVGHSTKTYWAVEKLFDKGSIDSLVNAPCLPIMVSMTCLEGSFHDPAVESLAEYAVRRPDDGAIASWTPTGFGLVTGHDLLEQGLMLAMLHDEVMELGAAITEAKNFLYDETHDPLESPGTVGQYDDLLDSFILLGDPGLLVKTDAVCSEIPTAVTLESAQAKAHTEGTQISWRTASETDVLGFNIWRQPQSQSPDERSRSAAKVNDELIFARRSGTVLGADYTLLDVTTVPGTSYQYELEVLHVDGSVDRHELGTVATFDRFYLPMVRAHQ